MTYDENKSLSRRFFEDVMNGRRLEVADELFAADYTHHDPSLPPELQQGLAAYKQILGGFLTAFSDLRCTVEDLLAEGNKVVARVTVRGTHDGELMGMPPSGRRVDFSLIGIHRIADGRIAEGWVVFDALGMLRQVGAIPEPAPAGQAVPA